MVENPELKWPNQSPLRDNVCAYLEHAKREADSYFIELDIGAQPFAALTATKYPPHWYTCNIQK